MIKRPLNARFTELVKSGVKTSTIREKPWRIGIPIMLYNWSGRPYNSPQVDVAPIIVHETRVIRITHMENGVMLYEYGQVNENSLHNTEGFSSRDELDAWFRPLIKRGETVEKAIMFFCLSTIKGEL